MEGRWGGKNRIQWAGGKVAKFGVGLKKRILPFGGYPLIISPFPWPVPRQANTPNTFNIYCGFIALLPVCQGTDRGNEFCHRPNLRGHAVVERDRNKKIAGATINLDINDLNLK